MIYRAAASGADKVIIVGDLGNVCHRDITVNEFETLVGDEAPWPITNIHDVVYEDSTFFAVGAYGFALKSEDGEIWDEVPILGADTIFCVCRSSTTWIALAGRKAWRSTDVLGPWTSLNAGQYATSTLKAVHHHSGVIVAVGNDLSDGEIAVSDDHGATWSHANVDNFLNGVTYGESLWIAVGDDGSIYTCSDPTSEAWSLRTSGVTSDLHDVGHDGTDFLAIGLDGTNIICQDAGLTWEERDSVMADLYGLCLIDGTETFQICGENYAGVSQAVSRIIIWEEFMPLSDIYRSNDFVVVDGQVLLIATSELEDGEWVYHHDRVRWTNPGTYNVFDPANFAALQGAHLISGAVSGSNVVLFEADRIGLLSPSGVPRWTYRVMDEGIWAVSNPVEVNQRVYFVANDGLLHAATANGVEQAHPLFDLSSYDDFSPDTEHPVILAYDRELRSLLILWHQHTDQLHLVSISTGAYSLWEIPENCYGLAPFRGQSEPRSLLGYQDTDTDTLLTYEVGFGEEITGTDADGSEFHGEFQSGLLRVTPNGMKAEIRELVVRTYCDQATTPDLLIMMKTTRDDEWRTLGSPAEFTLDGSASVAITPPDMAHNRLEAGQTNYRKKHETMWPQLSRRIYVTPTGVTPTDAHLVDQDNIVVSGDYTDVTFDGAGLDDIVVGMYQGGYNGRETQNIYFEVEITSTGTPDKYTPRIYENGVEIAGYSEKECQADPASDAMVWMGTVGWGATTGHTLGDKWTWAPDWEWTTFSWLYNKTPPTSSEDVWVYSKSFPRIKIHVGDYLEVGDEFVKIDAIPYARVLTMEKAVTGSGVRHVPATELPVGHGVTVVPVGLEVDDFQIRAILVPEEDTANAKIAKITSIHVVYLPTGMELMKEQS